MKIRVQKKREKIEFERPTSNGKIRKSGIKDAQDYAWAVGNQLEHLKAGKKLPNGQCYSLSAFVVAGDI